MFPTVRTLTLRCLSDPFAPEIFTAGPIFAATGVRLSDPFAPEILIRCHKVKIISYRNFAIVAMHRGLHLYGIVIDQLSNFFSLAFTCFPLSEHSLCGVCPIPSRQKYQPLALFLQ
jgi:hypothetical protein